VTARGEAECVTRQNENMSFHSIRGLARRIGHEFALFVKVLIEKGSSWGVFGPFLKPHISFNQFQEEFSFWRMIAMVKWYKEVDSEFRKAQYFL